MGVSSEPLATEAVAIATGTRPPRVLQLIHSNEAGGVEALANIIAGGLARHGVPVETHFLYPAFAVGKGVKIRGMLATAARLVKERPDIVIAYQSTASAITGLIGRLVGIRTRIVHQTAMPEAVHPLVRMLDKTAGSFGFYTVNIANSAATDAAFAAYPARYRANMRRIEHGLAPLRPRADRATTLARYGVPDDLPVLLAAGRLSDQKAQDRIIRALAQPQGERCRLVLAGGGPNEAQYRKLAADLGVTGRVHFLGYVAREDIGDLLGAADVFVFPSVWETFGLAPVEAAMAGVPVVAADLAVLREVMSADGETTARFVDTTDAGRFATAIAAAISEGPARARAFAPRIADKYALERMVDAYVALVGATAGARATG